MRNKEREFNKAITKVVNKNYLYIFIVAIVSLEAISFSIGNISLEEQYKLQQNLAREHAYVIQTALERVPVEAKAVAVYDVTENKKIYGKNDEAALPLASLAKIMTVIVALNNEPKESAGENVISISSDALHQEGNFGLLAGEKWKLSDLARFTLIASANDGAYALSGGDDNFYSKMNIKAQQIGTRKTLFLNSTGLDIVNAGLPAKAGALASAEDVNVMSRYALAAYPEIFRITTTQEINLKSESGFLHNFKNTDIIISKIPNLIFSKTGYSLLAGGNLAIIFINKNGHEIAVAILGSSYAGRFTDMEKIVNILYNT